MHVLVTGSSGRIGSYLVEKLLELGHSITGFDITPPSISDSRFRYIQGSLNEATAITEASKDAEAVIHLGALMSWDDKEAKTVFDINVNGTMNLLEAVSRQKLHRFIFASSGEVYPENSPEYLPVDENHVTNPTTYYGMTKHLGEQMVWFYARKFQIPSVVLRFSHTQDAKELLDPNSSFSGPRFFLRSKIKQQEKLGNKEVVNILKELDTGEEKLVISRSENGVPYRMCICDKRDLVQGILLAFQKAEAIGETFGIGPDRAISFVEAVQLMHKLTGLPIVEAYLPGPPVNYETSNDKARKLLGFTPLWDFNSMLEEALTVWEKNYK